LKIFFGFLVICLLSKLDYVTLGYILEGTLFGKFDYYIAS